MIQAAGAPAGLVAAGNGQQRPPRLARVITEASENQIADPLVAEGLVDPKKNGAHKELIRMEQFDSAEKLERYALEPFYLVDWRSSFGKSFVFI